MEPHTQVFNGFPLEIIELIFNRIPAQEYQTVACVCSLWNNVLRSRMVKKAIFLPHNTIMTQELALSLDSICPENVSFEIPSDERMFGCLFHLRLFTSPQSLSLVQSSSYVPLPFAQVLHTLRLTQLTSLSLLPPFDGFSIRSVRLGELEGIPCSDPALGAEFSKLLSKDPNIVPISNVFPLLRSLFLNEMYLSAHVLDAAPPTLRSLSLNHCRISTSKSDRSALDGFFTALHKFSSLTKLDFDLWLTPGRALGQPCRELNTITSLTNLRSLSIHDIQPDDIISISKFPNLKSLSVVGENRPSVKSQHAHAYTRTYSADSYGRSLCLLTSLRSLQFPAILMQCGDYVFKKLSALTSLVISYFEDFQVFAESNFQIFLHMPNLKSLAFTDCGSIPGQITLPPHHNALKFDLAPVWMLHLTSLSLESGRELPPHYRNVTKLTALKILRISKNCFYPDEHSQCEFEIASLTALHTLDLTAIHQKYLVSEGFSSLTRLTSLIMNAHPGVLPQLSSLQRLKHLEIRLAPSHGGYLFLVNFGRMVQLERLVYEQGLYMRYEDEFDMDLYNLKDLDDGENSTMFTHFKPLTRLTSLDVDKPPYITYELVKPLASLVRLRKLYLRIEGCSCSQGSSIPSCGCQESWDILDGIDWDSLFHGRVVVQCDDF